MQALKYAAMASRFTMDTLRNSPTSVHRGLPVSTDEALEVLTSHATDLASETLRTADRVDGPGFPPSVTASCVWL